MICKQCLCDCKEKDFYKSEICYKCIYKKKMEFISNYVKPLKLCKVCKSKIPIGKDVYCCETCAAEGKKRKDKAYWFRKCNTLKINWKN